LKTVVLACELCWNNFYVAIIRRQSMQRQTLAGTHTTKGGDKLYTAMTKS